MALSLKESIDELILLTLSALKGSPANSGIVDDETYHFFCSPAALEKSRTQGSVMKERSQSSLPSQDSTPDHECTNSQSTHRRLEKLLPRPFIPSPIDSSSTRSHIVAGNSIPHFSSVPLYHERSSASGSKRWMVYSYCTNAQSPTPKEAFVQSVIKAAEERLSVQVTHHSCYDPTFSLQLPIAVDDYEVVLFFVEAHLESSLKTLLESIKSFAHSSQTLDTPFKVLGSINGHPLRALILHASTHEDPSIKGQLWQSLKALATLTPPQ